MPELPEVEAIARTIRPLVVGRRIVDCRVLHPIVVGGTAGGRGNRARTIARARIGRAKGGTVAGVERCGKYLLLRLDSGWLMFHFRLDGQFVWYERGSRPNHIDVELTFPAGTLGFVDRRHLGRVVWLDRPEDYPGLARLGVDPLSSGFSAERLGALLKGSRRAVKLALMDQTKIAGLGNIWSCESLWRARIDPRRRGNGLSAAETLRLAKAIVVVVRRALESCLDPAPDFRNPDWWFADADSAVRVYGREGLRCPRCRARIRRIRQGGRSTFYCPGCQRCSPEVSE